MATLNPFSPKASMPWRINMIIQAWAFPMATPVAYLLGMVLGLEGEQALWVLKWVLPPIVLVCGNLYPYLMTRHLYDRVMKVDPTERAGIRLVRILKFPWRIALYCTAGGYVTSGFVISMVVCARFGKSFLLALTGTVIVFVVGLLIALPVGMIVERWMQPLAQQEQQRHPTLRVVAGGFFWPRQSWFLPYAFLICLLSLLLLGATSVAVQTYVVQSRFTSDLLAAGETRAAAMIEGLTQTLLAELSVPLAVLAVMLFTLPAISAWMLARRQQQGSMAVLESIEGLSLGRVSPPKWVSTDEVGDLAFGLHSIIVQLSAIPRTLQQSAVELAEASSTLQRANDAQRQALTTQATALQETNVTAQEIKQTSELTAQRAEAVLNVVTHAEEFGRTGNAAIAETMAGFSSIRDSVHAIRAKMERLQHSARQIGDITQTVKDLADQSNMLALNAAIEAVRSGEHGKGFSVVAREIRTLADQSIRATGRIRNILDEVGGAITDAVAMTDVGAEQVEGGLVKMKTSGDSLRQLSQMVNESSVAVRQITAAVSQQNAGVAQIFTAIADLSRSMDQAMERLESTQEAAQTLKNVSDQVGQVARQYHLD